MNIQIKPTLRRWTEFKQGRPLLVPPRLRATMAISVPEVVQKMQASGVTYKEAVQEFQKRYVLQVLTKHRCHLGKASKELSMHRNSLTRLFAILEIDIAVIRDDLRRRPLGIARTSAESKYW